MSEENVKLLCQGYEAFNRDDINTVMGLLDPAIEWQEPAVEVMSARGVTIIRLWGRGSRFPCEDAS